MLRAALIAALLALLALPGVADARWHPEPGLRWQWQLSEPPRAPFLDVDAYDVDGQETPRATVRALHRRGIRAICYLAAGSWERTRPDAGRYPAALLGRALEGWPGERWIDVRQLDGALAAILRDRLDTCARKGFDAVEPDNVDGYVNRSGFPLRARHQLRFNRWLAREAHRRGMAIFLKNDPDQAAALADAFDGALVEQCLQYRECSRYRPFLARGKPVLDVEYRGTLATICPPARRLGIDALRKRLALGAWRRAC